MEMFKTREEARMALDERERNMTSRICPIRRDYCSRLCICRVRGSVVRSNENYLIVGPRCTHRDIMETNF